MKNEFTLAFNEVLEEKQLPKDVILQALEAAMVSAYRRAVNASNAQQVEAKIDSETGKVRVYAEKEVVDQVQDVRTEVSVEDAVKVDPEAKVGSMVLIESTPTDFGRVAAQTARQVIQQRIREAERDAQLSYFSKQIGEIVSGVVQAVNPQAVTLGLEMKAEGIMPRNQQIGKERFRVHDRVRALMVEVKTSPRGPQLLLSRGHRNFLRRLLENEVPEIYHGMVEIRSIAREPGQRSKVAVAALQPGVDPVGACVGIRGVRIQAIVRELNDEKIDVIEWNTDPAIYIAKALSPARVTGVYLNEHVRGTKTATVVVPEDQLSLAIGRDGQNARLAAKLTSWRIDIKSLPEAATDALYKLQNDPEYAPLATQEAEQLPLVEAVLAKKSEGRPVTPEEYNLIGQFVDRVERGASKQRQVERKVEKDRRDSLRKKIPTLAFETPLDDLMLNERVQNQLLEAGFATVGDLMLQLEIDSDIILGMNGMGPKTMDELQNAINRLHLPSTTPEEAPVEAAPLAEAAAVPVETVPAEVEAALAEVAAPDEAAITAQAPAEVAEPAEGEAAPETVVEQPQAQPEGEPAEAEETAASLDELFALKPEAFETAESDEESDQDGDGKKKKKKKKFVEMEYDPDSDVMIVKRKHKRGETDWGDWSV